MKYSFLLAIAIVPVLLIAVGSVYTQENATDSDTPKFFAIQHAASGTITEINETSYSLELNDVSDTTILFSDRPDRIITSTTTTNFVDNWSVGTDSFADDAPNAVLVVDEKEQQDIAIVELFSPVYDSDKMTLKYEATPDNATSIDLPGEFGQSTIVIDDSRPILKPMPLNQ